jgi:methylenetetrahydrofolate dehydrogenase (NADP+) / methenyltetrahydrofolate cyclohydrolase
MESRKMSGAVVRDAIFAKLSASVASTGHRPGLGVVLVGDDPASRVYVASKGKACEKLGFHHVTHRLAAETPEDEVLRLIDTLNADPAIHGILVQIPLPKHIDEGRVQAAVDPRKDVDGFHPDNLGRLLAGQPRFIPCTPKGIVEMLRFYEIDLPGREVAIVGRSVIVGRPLAMLLSLKTDPGNATVTLCHSATRDLPEVTRRAHVVVAAMGYPGGLTREHIAEGAVVVDVGINRIDDPTAKKGYRLVGDVAPEALDGWASAYTPVPGGVGLMTIAMLMQNTWDAMDLLAVGS